MQRTGVPAILAALAICGSVTAGADAQPTTAPDAVYACSHASGTSKLSCRKLDRCVQHSSACTLFDGALDCARAWNDNPSPYRKLFPSQTLISSVYKVGKECLLLAWGQPKAGAYRAYVDRLDGRGWAYSKPVSTEANANPIATLQGYPPNVFFRAGLLTFTHGFRG